MVESVEARIMDNPRIPLDEIHELTDIYRIQRQRIDRLVEQELSGTPIPYLHKEIDVATKLLVANYRIKEAKGMVPPTQEDLMAKVQFKNYSQQTVEVLSNPESRHRIMSLLERVTRYGKDRREMVTSMNEIGPQESKDDKDKSSFDLPLPQSPDRAIIAEPKEDEKGSNC